MPIISIPVTLTTVAGAAFVNLWLVLRIGSVRRAERIDVGDGGSERLLRRMRAQANHIENAAFVLLLLLALELSRGTSVWLWAAGGLFLFARVAHGLGMDGGAFRVGRILGTAITMLLQLALGIAALASVYHAGHVAAAPTVEATPPAA